MVYAAIPSGPFETNAYVLSCPATGECVIRECVIIDPSPGSANSVIAYIEKNHLKAKGIWLTHSHWDHIADASVLMKHFNIPLSVHEEDAGNVEEPGSDGLPCWIAIDGVTPKHFFKDGEVLKMGNLQVQVIHTPGHTPGGVCFYLPDQNLLFSGDTLFKGTIGNLSFATARPALMWQSLAKLAKLPTNTKVLPGHGPSTTIGSEPWLRNAEQYFG